jgi:hypothetical protein
MPIKNDHAIRCNLGSILNLQIMIIPKNYHDELDKLNPKRVKITIGDEI